MAAKNQVFINDPINQHKCREVLDRIAKNVDGQYVIYATEYARPDNRLRGTRVSHAAQWAFDNAMKSMSKALASGLPADGWLVVTHEGISVFTRSMLGDRIGSLKGTIPHDWLASMSVDHGKKIGKNTLDLIFADNSEVTLHTKTKVTYPALRDWTDFVVSGAAEAARHDATGPIFDADALYAANPSLSH